MRRKRRLRVTGIALAGLLLVGGSLCWWLMRTESGLHSVLTMISGSGSTTIEHVGLVGNLGQFSAQSLIVETPAARLVLEDLELNWQPSQLVRRRLVIDQLTVGPILAKALTSPGNRPATDGAVKLPVDVQIDAAQVASIFWNGQPVATALTASVQLSRKTMAHSLALRGDVAPIGSLQLTAHGDATTSTVAAAVPDLGALAQVELNDWLDELGWTAELSAMDLSKLGVDGQFELQGEGSLREMHARMAGRIGGQPIALERLALTRDNDQLRLTGAGAIATVPLQFDARLDGQTLHQGQLSVIDYQPSAAIQIEQATLSAMGSWSELTVEGYTTGTATAPFLIELAGQLQPTAGFDLHSFSLVALDGQATGSGAIDWTNALQARAQLAVREVNLSTIDPRLPSVSANADLNWQDGQLISKFDSLQASVPASDTPITGQGEIRIEPGQHPIGQLSLEAGAANQLNLVLPTPVEPARLQANLSDLGSFVGGASGSLVGSIDVSADYQLAGQLRLNDLSIANALVVGHALLNAQTQNGEQQITLSASNGRIKDYSLDAVEAMLSGTVVQHRFSATATTTDESTLTLRGAGQWLDDRWGFELPDLSLALGDINASNTEPLRGWLSAEAFQLEPSCLAVEPNIANACGDATRENGQLRAQLSIDVNPIDRDDPRLAAVGLASLQLPQGARLNGSIGTQPLDLNFAASAAALTWQTADGDPLELGQLKFSANNTGDRIVLNGNLDIAGGNASIRGAIVEPAAPKFDAQLTLSLPDMSTLSPLLSDIDLRQGRLHTQLQLNGPIGSPQLTGDASASELVWALPALNIEQSGQVQVVFAGDSAQLSGEVRAGTGRAELNGQLGLGATRSLDVRVNGQALLLADSDDLTVAASPDLRIVWNDGALDVSGEIAIDRAFSSLALPANSGITRSADVVVTDDPKEESPGPMSTAVDVTARFTEPGRIEGQGLTGAVTGQLQVLQRPGQPATANGQLELTGNYRMLGQSLTIENGRLIYTNSPLSDPTIEAYASRTVDEVTVGVRISGKAATLQTALESKPTMPETDILHYLVLGRAPGTQSASESEQLSAAALALALRRSQSGVQSVGERLGATEFGLTQELGGLALAIGKQLSPRLYVGYTVGLLEPIDIARIKYQLSRHWSLQAEISDESRAGLKYRIDKG